MQHIRRREKRFSRSFGDCEKDISEFEGNPTDSDPGYEVTEDFEVAYERAVRDYKRNLRLRRIQILLRISLVLVLLGVLGVAACLSVALTSHSPIPPTPRPTTTTTTPEPSITTEPFTTAETTASPIQTTAISISTSTANSSTSPSAEPSSTTPFTTSPYRPLSNHSVQVIVGGKTSGYRGILNSSIELFPRPPSKDCYIPDIVSDKPEAQLRRARHSLSLMRGGVLVICGGWDDHTSLDSCVSWVDGNSSWTHLFTMRKSRWSHSAWTPKDIADDWIILFGGEDTPGLGGDTEFTAEILPEDQWTGTNGTFALKHSGQNACGIPDGLGFVMTGGGNYNDIYNHNFVTRVVGGREDYGEGPSENRRFQVLEYQPKNQSWVTVGNLEEIRRYGHAVLSIGPYELPCLAGEMTYNN